MCGKFFSNLFTKPAAQQQVLPARQADEARDPNAVVKDTTDSTSEVTGEGTGVSVKRNKQVARQGVPGLNL